MTKGRRGREMELDREKVRQRIDREEGKIKSNDETSNEPSGVVKVGCAARTLAGHQNSIYLF